MTTDASSGPSSLTIPMPFMGIYDVSLPAHTGAAAGTYDASFVHAKVDPVRVQQLLDDKSSRRYVFRLPKPEEYVPAGRDESRVADAYPPPSSTQGSHATGFSLRYNVSSLSGFSVSGTPDVGPAFTPLLLQVDTPFVRFMIPSAEADDGCFTHSRQAFHGLVNLVGLKLYVDFPDYTDDCRKKDPQIGQAKTGSVDSLSVEQQAAALKNLGRHVEEIMVQPFIAARAPSSSQRYPLAALHFLFGRPSGICHAPVIGGGP